MTSRNDKVHYSAVSLFYWPSLDPVKIWGYFYISKPQRILWVTFPRTGSALCIYHLFVWSNLNYWHNSQGITFPTHSCLRFALIYYIRSLLLLFYSTQGFFYTSFKWSFLTGVWVTASLLKCPRFFSLHWLILITLYFGWLTLVLLFPNPPVSLSILGWLYWAHVKFSLFTSTLLRIWSQIVFIAKSDVFASYTTGRIYKANISKDSTDRIYSYIDKRETLIFDQGSSCTTIVSEQDNFTERDPHWMFNPVPDETKFSKWQN